MRKVYLHRQYCNVHITYLYCSLTCTDHIHMTVIINIFSFRYDRNPLPYWSMFSHVSRTLSMDMWHENTTKCQHLELFLIQLQTRYVIDVDHGCRVWCSRLSYCAIQITYCFAVDLVLLVIVLTITCLSILFCHWIFVWMLVFQWLVDGSYGIDYVGMSTTNLVVCMSSSDNHVSWNWCIRIAWMDGRTWGT